MQRVLTRPAVPTLFVGGWWDAEDILGPQLAYHIVERADSQHWNRIVLGPWYHGEWAGRGTDSIGAIPVGSNTARYFREQIQRPWFAFYLHGTGDGHFPEAWAFETGENRWHTFDAWPPRTATPRNIYLRENGKLSFDPPPRRAATSPPANASSSHSADYDAWTSDPANPVPYLPRPDRRRLEHLAHATISASLRPARRADLSLRTTHDGLHRSPATWSRISLPRPPEPTPTGSSS